MYEHLRESLRKTLEHWGFEVTDDDVSDLTKFRLKAVFENAESFKLYRYMPSQYFNIRNLETQTIHLSPNGIMNDVFEELPEYFDSISYSQLQKLGDLAYMTCFTETEDNLLLWSHYADYHKEFCIEYVLKKLNDDPFDLLNHVFPVIYTEKRQAERNLSSLANSHALLTEAMIKMKNLKNRWTTFYLYSWQRERIANTKKSGGLFTPKSRCITLIAKPYTKGIFHSNVFQQYILDIESIPRLKRIF